VIAGKLYTNCAKLMKVILECKRSEDPAGFDAATARDVSSRLDENIRKKNAEEIINIMANCSDAQIKSINDAYMATHKKKTVLQAAAFAGIELSTLSYQVFRTAFSAISSLNVRRPWMLRSTPYT
jgi:hypothetical protein